MAKMREWTPRMLNDLQRRAVAHNADLASYFGCTVQDIKHIRQVTGIFRIYHGEKILGADIYRVTNLETGKVVLKDGLIAEAMKAMNLKSDSAFNRYLDASREGTPKKWLVEEVSWELAEKGVH